jgi:hypothetical protein
MYLFFTKFSIKMAFFNKSDFIFDILKSKSHLLSIFLAY